MPCTALDFDGRHSDSPPVQREYLQMLTLSRAIDNPPKRTVDDENMRTFLRKWAGVKFEGDQQIPG